MRSDPVVRKCKNMDAARDNLDGSSPDWTGPHPDWTAHTIGVILEAGLRDIVAVVQAHAEYVVANR